MYKLMSFVETFRTWCGVLASGKSSMTLKRDVWCRGAELHCYDEFRDELRKACESAQFEGVKPEEMLSGLLCFVEAAAAYEKRYLPAKKARTERG